MYNHPEYDVKTVPKTSARILERWYPGNTKASRIGLGLAEYGRAYMQRPDPRKQSFTRLQRVIDALYEVATDTSNKQCVAASNILLTRFYGMPQTEMSKEDAFLLMVQDMPAEHKAYLAQLLMPNKDQIGIDTETLLADSESEEDELPEGVEDARFTEIPAEDSQTPR